MSRASVIEHVSISGHNDPKYIGSTGFLPTLQSYLCRWNNTCHNQTYINDQFSSNASWVFHCLRILVYTTFRSSLWNQLSGLADNLSIVLNDEQTSSALRELFSRLNTFNNLSTAWNGKSVAGYLLRMRRTKNTHQEPFWRIKHRVTSINQQRSSLRSLPIRWTCPICISRGSWRRIRLRSRMPTSPSRSTWRCCNEISPT